MFVFIRLSIDLLSLSVMLSLIILSSLLHECIINFPFTWIFVLICQIFIFNTFLFINGLYISISVSLLYIFLISIFLLSDVLFPCFGTNLIIYASSFSISFLDFFVFFFKQFLYSLAVIYLFLRRLRVKRCPKKGLKLFSSSLTFLIQRIYDAK